MIVMNCLGSVIDLHGLHHQGAFLRAIPMLDDDNAPFKVDAGHAPAHDVGTVQAGAQG